MARLPRIEYPGAFHHAYARGNARAPIFLNDGDRRAFLRLLEKVVVKFGWRCHAYCLMPNHYHLAVETPQPNLSRGMAHLNGVYTQWFNTKYERAGHLFQGRFKSSLVENGGYFRDLCRYIVLNPVRGKRPLCRVPEEWPWSSHRATAGIEPPLYGLTTALVLAQFGSDHATARESYREFVAAGKGLHDDAFGKWGSAVGTEAFMERCLREDISTDARVSMETAIQKTKRPSLERIFAKARSRHTRTEAFKKALQVAMTDHSYTAKEVAAHLGVHASTIGRNLPL